MKLTETAKSQFKLVFAGLVFMICSYLLLIFLWDATSAKYKPANFLDLEVKTPAHTSEWLTRREHGI